MFAVNIFLTLLLLLFVTDTTSQSMPAPFYRELEVTSPYMTGNDVLIAQTLLLRDKSVQKYCTDFTADSEYGPKSAEATATFQKAHGLPDTGILDSASAQKLLTVHSDDGVRDSGFSAGSLGYLYKIHLPVHWNRSIETYGTLYDKDNNVLMRFKAREHGIRSDGTSVSWPDFGDGDIGLTQFASNGNTVTGLIEVDLNSPEPNPQVYGPWPINRLVRGLEGNALLLLPNIRDGLLIHTGNWTTATGTWLPTDDMPNSSGCIHSHPSEVEQIYKTLLSIGVTVRENPFSGKNYPYKPQGIAVIEAVL